MAFGIQQHVVEDGDYDEDAALVYREALMSRFSTAPEGHEVVAKLGGIGWANTLWSTV